MSAIVIKASLLSLPGQLCFGEIPKGSEKAMRYSSMHHQVCHILVDLDWCFSVHIRVTMWHGQILIWRLCAMCSRSWVDGLILRQAGLEAEAIQCLSMRRQLDTIWRCKNLLSGECLEIFLKRAVPDGHEKVQCERELAVYWILKGEAGFCQGPKQTHSKFLISAQACRGLQSQSSPKGFCLSRDSISA